MIQSVFAAAAMAALPMTEVPDAWTLPRVMGRDFWTLQCMCDCVAQKTPGVYDLSGIKEAAVRFQHVGTSVFLSVTGEQYGSPIRGQHEVHGMASASAHNKWKAMEGIFIKPSPEAPGGHDEL